MTPHDEAAIAAGKAAAVAGMHRIEQGQRLAEQGRVERDAGIKQMMDAGATLADVARDLGIPKSTVRQARQMAAVREARR